MFHSDSGRITGVFTRNCSIIGLLATFSIVIEGTTKHMTGRGNLLLAAREMVSTTVLDATCSRL